jgi:hypothetical protein
MATVEGGAHCYPEFDPAVCIQPFHAAYRRGPYFYYKSHALA